EHHRHSRAARELLKLYCFYYRTGHYHAAAFVAERALQLDPSNVAAEAALCMARMATDAIDHGRGDGDAEDCEAAADPAPGCGKGGRGGAACDGCGKSAAKACGKSAARATCACGADCGCKKDAPCACGVDCCCDKAQRQRVLRHHGHIFVVPFLDHGTVE